MEKLAEVLHSPLPLARYCWVSALYEGCFGTYYTGLRFRSSIGA